MVGFTRSYDWDQPADTIYPADCRTYSLVLEELDDETVSYGDDSVSRRNPSAPHIDGGDYWLAP